MNGIIAGVSAFLAEHSSVRYALAALITALLSALLGIDLEGGLQSAGVPEVVDADKGL